MNNKKTKQKERGQSLVLVALAMIGLLAFAGLALDGGLAYATRRVAQNAADSGAIAGSYELHQQKWKQQVDANSLDQLEIMKQIHQVVESHGVPDTDGNPGNEINDNVRAFYVSQGAPAVGCSNVVDTGYQELCQLDANSPCNATDVWERAIGISIEVDVPFEPIFAGLIGWNEIEVSNRASDFDQRTAAVVDARDTGFNSDLWAIFAMSYGETSGPSTFIQIDPIFQPPTGFAFANVHSKGSFSVGNHFPIMGQVTHCTTGGCSNCFNALLLPEQTQKHIEIPDFTLFATLAQTRADHIESADITTWGKPFNEPFEQVPEGIWFIDGNLRIEEDTIAVLSNGFIYVTGSVTINGLFFGQDLSIISGGPILINGTLSNSGPYPTNVSDPDFNNNVAVLWSQSQQINVTGLNQNQGSIFSNVGNDIRGAVIAENSTVTIASNSINTTVRGSVIGNEVFIISSPDTLSQTRIQYNGNYFPGSPDRIELLK